jgi:hypothetical protein
MTFTKPSQLVWLARYCTCHPATVQTIHLYVISILNGHCLITFKVGSWEGPLSCIFVLVISWGLELWVNLQHLLDGVVPAFLEFSSFAVFPRVQPLAVARIDRFRRRGSENRTVKKIDNLVDFMNILKGPACPP